MGYTTYFEGGFEFDKPVSTCLSQYINNFADVRHMKRDVEKLKEVHKNWRDECFFGDLGKNGEYFVGDVACIGADILDINCPDSTQPGLWCQWVVNGNRLEWDGGEKFYNYIDWLEYLIKHFIEPTGYTLNGEVEWDGEDYDDNGCIVVENNKVHIKYGRAY